MNKRMPMGNVFLLAAAVLLPGAAPRAAAEELKERAVLAGHTQTVEAVAFSPDGRRLASGSHDWYARLWDPATGKEVGPTQKHICAVMGIGFINEGKQLAVGGASGAVRWWEAGEAKKFEEPGKEPWGSASLYAFSPDGKTMALVSYGGHSLDLYDLTADPKLLVLLKETETVFCLAFTADGKMLASGGADKKVRLWDAAGGKEKAVLSHPDAVHAVAFTADGKTLVSACADGGVRLWDVATGQEKSVWKGHDGAVRAVAVTPDGKAVASGGSDRRGILWDAVTGKQRTAIKGHDGAVRSLAFSPDGKVLASGAEDKLIKLWDVPAP